MPKKILPTELLFYADSESNADMLYFGEVFVPDAFIALSIGKRRIAVVNQLEFGRVSRESRFDDVLPLEDLLPQARAAFPKVAHPASVIALLKQQFGIGGFSVASDFPFGVAQQLQQIGIRIEVADSGGLLPQRELKSDAEAAAIGEGNAASAAGFKVVEKALRAAEIRKGWLYFEGRRLTSERLQELISIACLGKGAVAANTIVAGGDQACDPHCRGSGPLRADQFIIVDIFPRVAKTGFHGDMTRTYLKGRASDAQKALYATVLEAQQFAIGEHRARKSGRAIYDAVCARFVAAGYETSRKDGTPVGFIHGLGHGLGLAVHEAPRVNAAGERLRSGQVITVEPGLYYPGLGGVRVEDVLRVTTSEPEMLSSHPYRWHFR